MGLDQPGRFSVAWKVTGQVPNAPGVDANGKATRGVEVSYLTDSGQSGTVFVPNASYNVDTVRQMIVAHSAVADGIAGLSG